MSRKIKKAKMSRKIKNAEMSPMMINAKILEMRIDHLNIYCQAAQNWCFQPKPTLEELSDLLVQHPEFKSSPYRLAQFFYDSKSPKSTPQSPKLAPHPPDPPQETRRIWDKMTPDEYREWIQGDWTSD